MYALNFKASNLFCFVLILGVGYVSRLYGQQAVKQLQRVFFPILGIFPILGRFLTPIFRASARVQIFKIWMQAGARVVVAGGIRSPVLRFPEVCLRLNSAVALFRCYLLLTSVPQLLQCQVQTVARALISCCGLSAELCRGKPAAAETGAGGGTGRKNRLPARASGGARPPHKHT